MLNGVCAILAPAVGVVGTGTMPPGVVGIASAKFGLTNMVVNKNVLNKPADFLVLINIEINRKYITNDF
jgi:hypothetical protein